MEGGQQEQELGGVLGELKLPLLGSVLRVETYLAARLLKRWGVLQAAVGEGWTRVEWGPGGHCQQGAAVR